MKHAASPRHIPLSILFFLVFIVLQSCSTQTSQQNLLGGSEAGNPPTQTTRSLTGTLVLSESLEATDSLGLSISATVTEENCSEFSLRATDETGLASQVAVNSDCSFQIELTFGHFYRVEILFGSEQYAYMVFDNGSGEFDSEIFRLDESESPMLFGHVTIQDGIAIAEFNPAEQNDEDSDGQSDYVDADSSIRNQVDCDEDGLPDSFENEADVCVSNDTSTEPTEDDSSEPTVVKYTPEEATAGGPFDCDGDGVLDSDVICDVVCPDGTVQYDVDGNLLSCY